MDNDVKEILMQLVEGQKRTDKRLDKMQEDITTIRKDLTTTQSDVQLIKIELENTVSPAIKTLCEMQLDNSKRLQKLEHDMQELNDQLAIGEVLHGLKESKLL